ncbi:MAG TPA: TlpA disulfide reductase family protein [Gemmataceae bacterium]|nr:TlpA disulfide reductase family protein [Gemmataceae bacterium]
MSRVGLVIFAFAFVFLAPALSLAQDYNMSVKAEQVLLAKTVFGPEVTPADMKGRVTLLYYWGVDCPDCLNLMPKIAKYNEELAPFGLLTIAPHAQISTPENMKAKAKARGANFSVVEQAANTQIKGKAAMDFNQIPHCILYDEKGKCIYRGLPEKLELPLRQTMGKLLAGKFEEEPAKPLVPLIDSLKKGQPPAGVLQKLVALTKSSDSTVAEQAKDAITKLTVVAEKMAVEMEAQKTSDPVAAYTRALKFSVDFKGTAPGTKAAEVVAELKKDKVVVEDTKARPVLEKIRATDEELTKALGIDDPKGKAFHKAQASALKQLQSEIKAMKKSWPDAPSTKEALEIADKYGLPLK